METNTANKIRYAQAKKRVEEVRNFWLFVLAYLGIVALLQLTNVVEKWLHFRTEYTHFWIILQGIFLIVYGIYLYVPYFRNWENRKISDLMNKENKNQ